MVKTLIAIPCFDMVHTDFMESLINLRKPEGTSYTLVKNTLVHDARNIIANNAIEAGFDRIMWFDSDMRFPPDTLLKLSEDMDQGLDYVSGLYFTRRQPNIRPVVFSEMSYKVDEQGKYESKAEFYYDYPEGLFECAATGFGCCLTSVDLIKRVSREVGSPFDPIPTMGEDVSFCHRVQQIGGKMYCDSRVKCGHIGAFEYNEAVYKSVNG